MTSFQTTYEELKHLPAPLPSLRRRFQTTYEELKHPAPLPPSSRISLPDYLWGIETMIPTWPWFQMRASRLPMRNWNWKGWSGICPRPELPDYLWGIETSASSRSFSISSSLLPDYLWGIETLPDFFQSIFCIASRLPMRNWNKRESRCSSDNRYLASRLPMRNWNAYPVEASNRNEKASRLPMRNWNLRGRGYDHCQRHASRLPMRNWNISRLEGKINLPWLPDYLWGIETYTAHWRRGHTLRFQTTYEELKPDNLDPVDPDNRFQTTYEELKRTNGGGGAKPSACFQTTYEELKPASSTAQAVFPDPASRLPMRNWNIYELTHYLSNILLPDYLWGIETSSHANRRRFDNGASRLPMRNWNLGQGCRYRPGLRFQTTYEELKPGTNCLVIRSDGASRLPMRNWNSIYEKHFPDEDLASRLPMRNWNPDPSDVIYSGIWLPDYLWGIETGNVVLFDWWESRFQTTYEELKPLNSKADFDSYGFQTTYEELKLRIRSVVPWKAELPDYLWGIETNQSSRACFFVSLPDYLWGIETPTKYKTWQSSSVLPDYLWGIETSRIEVSCPL